MRPNINLSESCFPRHHDDTRLQPGPEGKHSTCRSYHDGRNFAFSLRYTRCDVGRTRTLSLGWQWAQPGKRRKFIKSPTTSQRTPWVTAVVVPLRLVLYSSTVIEISSTLIHNMPIITPDPCTPPTPTSVPQTYSRDNRNARDSLTARLSLAPSRSMRQVGANLRSTAAMTRKLLKLSPVRAMRKQANCTDQAAGMGEDNKGSHGGERYRGRGSK
jgi:hypothetical protein